MAFADFQELRLLDFGLACFEPNATLVSFGCSFDQRDLEITEQKIATGLSQNEETPN